MSAMTLLRKERAIDRTISLYLSQMTEELSQLCYALYTITDGLCATCVVNEVVT